MKLDYNPGRRLRRTATWLIRPRRIYGDLAASATMKLRRHFGSEPASAKTPPDGITKLMADSNPPAPKVTAARSNTALEHPAVEPAGILVVARAVIAIEQHAASGQMSRRDARICASRQPAERSRGRLVRDPAERDHTRALVKRDQRRSKWLRQLATSSGIGLFSGGRHLTALRMTAPFSLSPSWIGAIFAFGQPEFQQRPVQQIAGKIASEGPPGAVGALLAGREADDRQPRIGSPNAGTGAFHQSGCSARHSCRKRPAAGRAGSRAALRLRDGDRSAGLAPYSHCECMAVKQRSLAMVLRRNGQPLRHRPRLQPAAWPSWRPPEVEAAIARLDQEFGLFDAVTDHPPRRARAVPAATSPMLLRSSKAISALECSPTSRRPNATSAAAPDAAGDRACSISTSPCGAAAMESRRPGRAPSASRKRRSSCSH